MTEHYDERSLGELVSDLSNDLTLLVRQEIELAKTEMSQKIPVVTRNVSYIGSGGVIAYTGFMALVAAAVIGFAYLVPLWLSALLIGIFLAAVGSGMMMMGVSKLKRLSLMPEHTLLTLKEDKTWLKDQMK